MNEVIPARVLERVTAAIPEECRTHIIVAGSLAAGYLLLGRKQSLQIRTKDIDCVLSPRIAAVNTGQAVADTLIANGWTPEFNEKHPQPGNALTPDDDLPAVRLHPPDSIEWFIEFLTVPNPEETQKRNWTRMKLKQGYFGLPSFRFLSLVQYQPIMTPFGVSCARPEMMALANLLEHPYISNELMSGLILGRSYKRSNKDLGRVIAIAHLHDPHELEDWPEHWSSALRTYFPEEAFTLAKRAGAGIEALLNRPEDMEQAYTTSSEGLLAHWPVSQEEFRVTAERLLVFAVEPLKQLLRQ